MADVKKIIDIVFRGVDKTSSVTKSLSSGIDDFSSKVGGIAGPFADIANKATALEAAVLGASAAFIGYSYIATSQFESAQLDLQKVMLKSEGSVDDYADRISYLSDRFGVASGKVLEGTTNFKLAGFSIGESFDLMEESIKLMIAGNVDATNSTEILVSILKGFKAEASEATRVVDILNEVSNNYATDVQELGNGMARLSPIANLMGFTFEETAGILTPVIEVFRSGNEAANALKTGLLRLVDDSKPVQNALAQIGVSQRDANGNLKSGKEILNEVAVAFQTAAENDKLFLATQLAGTFQAGKMVEVFNGLAKSTEITSIAMHASGSAMKEVELRLSSIEIAGQRAIVSFNNIALAFGKELKNEITAVINAFTTLEQSLAKAIGSGSFAPLLEAIRPVLGDIQSLFEDMAKNLPNALKNVDFTGLIDSLQGLQSEVLQAFEALFGDIDLRSADGLTKAIQKIIDGITALTRVTTSIIDTWEPFLELIGKGIEKISSSDKAAQDAVGTFLGWTQIITKVTDNIDILTNSLSIFGTGLGLFGLSSLTKVTGLFNALGTLGPLATKAATGLGTLALGGVSFGIGWTVGSTLRLAFPEIDTFTQKLIGAADSVLNFTGTQNQSNETMEEIAERFRKNTEHLRELKKAEDEASGKVEVQFEIVDQSDDAKEVREILMGKKPPDQGEWWEGLDVPWVIEPKIDQEKLDKEKEDLQKEVLQVFDEFGNVRAEIVLDAKVDDEKAKKQIDELPKEKELEIKLKGEIDKQLLTIEQEFITIRELAKIQSEVDIADIEAKTERIKAAFESVNVGIESTGKSITDMVGLLAGDLDIGTKFDIQNYIDREYAFREQEFELQKQLAQDQMSLNRAKKKFFAGEGGQAAIKIESSGVYPALELVLEELVRRAQVTANALGLSILIGLPEVTGES